MRGIKSIFHKTLIAMLVISMCSGLFMACGQNSSDNGEETTKNELNASETETETTTEGRLYPDLPDDTYDGRDFTFLSMYVGTSADWIDWHPRDLYAETITADLINDAVYERNSTIESQYDVNIKEVRLGEAQFTTTVRNSYASGDNTYDVVLPRIKNSVALATRGMFANLYAMPNINLSNPWWNQSAVSQLSIGGNLYIVDSDLLVISNDSVEALLFNKTLIEDHALESPYDLVKEGKWTIDKLIEMSSAGVANDLDGDGTMHLLNDKFGLALQRDSMLSLYNAAGGSIIEKDSDDLPIIAFASEKNYGLLDKITNLMRDKQNVVDLHRYNGQFGIYDAQAKAFSENRALFTWVRMRIVENLRNMEADFGILPLPKYDENQTNYISRINSHVPTGISVLNTHNDLDFVGVMLEALSAESKYTVQPAYYELNLKTKIVRDDDSELMLDIIFDSNHMFYDLSEIYQFASFADTIFRIPTEDKATTYASIFEGKQDAIQKAIDDLVEKYEKAAS